MSHPPPLPILGPAPGTPPPPDATRVPQSPPPPDVPKAAWITVAAGFAVMIAVWMPWWTASVELSFARDPEAGGSAELGVIRGASVVPGRVAAIALLVGLLAGLAALGSTSLRIRRNAGFLAMIVGIVALAAVLVGAVAGPQMVGARLDRSIAAQDLARSETTQSFATELAEDPDAGAAQVTFGARPHAGIPLTAMLALASAIGGWLVWRRPSEAAGVPAAT